MNFSALPKGTPIFLDANIFVYFFGADPLLGPPCRQLLEDIENSVYPGFTSAGVLGNVAHRLMTIEARTILGWPAFGIAHRLKRHPIEVQKLSRYRQAIDEIRLIGIQVLPVTGPQVSTAADFGSQFGMMSEDGLVVSVMRDHGLIHLASHDADFDRVSGITRYAPV